MNPDSTPTQVRWRRVATFYGIALGWVILLGGLLYLVGQRDLGGTSAPWVGAILAIAYMPIPLVAALIMEKRDGRGFRLGRIFRAGLGRALLVTAVLTVAIVVGLVLLMLGASWLAGNVAGIGGAGRVLFSTEDLVANVIALSGASVDAAAVAAMTASMPPLWLLLLITVGSAVAVGFTINGLFAFGEEYGWRGWLADELADLGAVRANLITGVMWGLWHAPLILLGYNYGSYRLPGVVAMIGWCIAASFLLWRVRQATGTVLAPAVVHGAINGFAGVFLIVLADPNRLLAAPMGVIGIATVAIVAGVVWLFTRPAPRDVDRAPIAVDAATGSQLLATPEVETGVA